MTTVNQLKKVLFDQKNPLITPNTSAPAGQDVVAEDKVVFIVQDWTTRVPGRAVPETADDPVYPVRRMKLSELMTYIGSAVIDPTPVLCLQSSAVEVNDGMLIFTFRYPPFSSYNKSGMFRMTAVGPEGTFTMTYPAQNDLGSVDTSDSDAVASAESSTFCWFTDVNLTGDDIHGPSDGVILGDHDTTAEVALAKAFITGTGISSTAGQWTAYLWVYRNKQLI